MQRINILGSLINGTNMKEVITEIEELMKKKKSYYICVSNVHTVVTGKKDVNFRNITNGSYMAVPDGMPLTWVGRSRGFKNMSKCSGPDLMEELFKLSEEKGYTHYFYGGSEEALAKLRESLETKYPRLNIRGMYSPPFRTLTKEEDVMIIAEINRLSPDIVWVGLGAPKQEIWMAEHVDNINKSLLFGVGAAFNFHSGTVKRAPIWMQNMGLEWFYRLIKEPRRLWKRYLVTNTSFVFYLIMGKLQRK